jgi:tRNA pseudouridine13 synthase
MSELPYAHGEPPVSGRLRAQPEDFRVEEILGYAADGEGEHVLIEVEKREANTDWVARELARFAGVAPVAVSYAGRKDRHALTRQHFSVHLAGRDEPDWSAFSPAGVRVVASARHRRKLKRGALAGNRFALTVRDVDGDRECVEQRLHRVLARGVPNYFGAQRFGHGGANVERARALFAGRRVNRATRSMLVSAARSHLFNAVLAERVRRGTWDDAMEGEVWCLAGSRSHFGPEPIIGALRERLAHGDIHPSGPLWGRGELPTQGEARHLEQAAADADPNLAAGLSQRGLVQERRPLRLMPAGFAWNWPDQNTVVLRFDLPPGSYATVVARELVRDPSATAIG